MAVAYTPHILKTIGEICDAFGVGEKIVKQWAAASAALQDWRIQRHPVRQDASLSSAED